MQSEQVKLFVDSAKLLRIFQATQFGEVNASVVKAPVHVVVAYNLASPVEQSSTKDLVADETKKDAPSAETDALKHCCGSVAVTVISPVQVCVLQNVAHFGVITAGAGAGLGATHAP